MKVRPYHFIILSIIWMSIIFCLSSLPSTSTGPDTPFFKAVSKMLHFIIFGILSILYLSSLKWNKPLRETRIKFFLFSLFLTSIYAMTDEYHQSFSPGRTPSVRDVIIDTCGALTFLTIAYFLTRFVKHDEKN